MKTIAARTPFFSAIRSPFAGFTFNRVLTMLSVAQERRELSKLSPAQLKDIGLEPSAAAAEAARPFWDLPQGR